MWICSRVGARNSLAALRQLRIYGTRYRIEKVQKLCENFEKACWRSVRVAEERAYMQKYHFLRHCVSVMERARRRAPGARSPTQPGPARLPLSRSILSRYDGSNAEECLEAANALLARLEPAGSCAQPADESPQDPKRSSGEAEPASSEEATQAQRAPEWRDREDVKKLKNIIGRLRGAVERARGAPAGPDRLGYSRAQLERMAKL